MDLRTRAAYFTPFEKRGPGGFRVQAAQLTEFKTRIQIPPCPPFSKGGVMCHPIFQKGESCANLFFKGGVLRCLTRWRDEPTVGAGLGFGGRAVVTATSASAGAALGSAAVVADGIDADRETATPGTAGSTVSTLGKNRQAKPATTVPPPNTSTLRLDGSRSKTSTKSWPKAMPYKSMNTASMPNSGRKRS